MTMRSDRHPDDLRLSAYAGGDAHASSDRALASHVDSCARCTAIVIDLQLLRGALADLPDLAPSRPLRLIPPVPAPAARRSGPLEWVRRLAAPAMAAGAGLVLIGAVGASGLLGGLGGVGGGTVAQEASASGRSVAAPGATSPVPGALDGASQSVVPARSQASGEYSGRTETPHAQPVGVSPSPAATREAGKDSSFGNLERSSAQPWLTLLIAGVGLFGVSAVLRFSLAPRAG